MKKMLAVIVLLLLGVAWLAGYWPERGRRVAAEAERGALQQQLDDARAKLRLAGLLGRVLALEDAVAQRDYGVAQQLTSAFFDEVRAASDELSQGEYRGVLESVLGRRDAVTAALTQADPAVMDVLESAEVELRQALHYPVPTRPSPESSLAAHVPMPTPAPGGAPSP